MKQRFLFLSLAVAMLMASCSNVNQVPSRQGSLTQDESNLMSSLPEGFTLTKIESAIQHYINDQLWYYPKSIVQNQETNDFSAYVGKSIEMEVRSYNGEIYVSDNTDNDQGEWLAYFKKKRDTIYCDALVGPNDPIWPNSEYQVIDRFQIEVQEPYKPNYGNSIYKDQMVAAAITYLKQFMGDMQRGDDAKGWNRVQGYLVNFHEYDESANAWFLKENNEAIYVPFIFIEENGTYRVNGVKGYSIDKVFDKNPNDPDRFMLEKQIQDAIKKKVATSNEWENVIVN